MERILTFPHYILASKNIRALNFIIDLIIINIVKISFFIAAAFITFNSEYMSMLDWLNSFNNADFFLFMSSLIFFYYFVLEIAFARTIAKFLTGTIVVLIDGSKPKPIDILKRTLLRLIPFEYFTFLKGRKPGWHDDFSKTFVVVKAKLENNKMEFLE